jgi:hypothetical protein
MPRGQLTKQEIKIILLTYKKELYEENVSYTSDPKALANKYLNKILEKIEEYAR